MKAVVYTQYGLPEVLYLDDVEKPEPKQNEVLIKIVAAAVSSADSAIRKGEQLMVRLAFGLYKPKKTVLGTEFSGIIEAIGNGVTRFKLGDQVFAASGIDFGAHAEYICLPEDGALELKPANISHQQAAAICEGGLTALPFLRGSANLQAGQKILINGASGSVGVSAIQLARYFGAEVTAVCSTSNLELVKSLGANKVIDYSQQDFTKKSLLYDVIFDAAGKSTFTKCKNSLMETGVYITTGVTRSIFIHQLLTSKIYGKKAKIAFTGLRSAAEKSDDLKYLRNLTENGDLKPVIGRCYPVANAVDAHRYVDTGHKQGNAIISL